MSESFQSTPPARGATSDMSVIAWSAFYFNPRPPRGGRPWAFLNTRGYMIFQSTPPARGATNTDKRERLVTDISIHAPREGGDDGTSSIYYLP